MILRYFLAFWLLLGAPFFAQADSLAEARIPVERLNGTLIEVMKGGQKLGYAGRYKKARSGGQGNLRV